MPLEERTVIRLPLGEYQRRSPHPADASNALPTPPEALSDESAPNRPQPSGRD
jgi:hypothetical protein